MALEESLASAWQPIETAPRDRDVLLVYLSGAVSQVPCIGVGHFISDTWGWDVGVDESVAATHWQPVPAVLTVFPKGSRP